MAMKARAAQATTIQTIVDTAVLEVVGVETPGSWFGQADPVQDPIRQRPLPHSK